MTDDEMTSRLAQLRADLLAAAADADGATITTVLFRLGMALGVADTAMKAVDAALGFHERVGLYGNASTEGEPGNCPHHPDSDLHFEDPNGSTEWLCRGRPEGSVCSSCTDEDGLPVAYPCDEREAILKALTGRRPMHDPAERRSRDEYLTIEEFAALPPAAQIAVWAAHTARRVEAVPASAKSPNGAHRYRRDQVRKVLAELAAGTEPGEGERKENAGA